MYDASARTALAPHALASGATSPSPTSPRIKSWGYPSSLGSPSSYAHWLQLQERLTYQIANEIQRVTASSDVMVVGRGQHLCMSMRGIKTDAIMSNSVVCGRFRDLPALRAETLNLMSSREKAKHNRVVHPSGNLETLKGVGQDSAAVYASFIGDPHRFSSTPATTLIVTLAVTSFGRFEAPLADESRASARSIPMHVLFFSAFVAGLACCATPGVINTEAIRVFPTWRG